MERIVIEIDTEKFEELSIRRGVYLAAAEVARAHDQPTLAVELLRISGPVNFDGIDAYDADVLRPLISPSPEAPHA